MRHLVLRVLVLVTALMIWWMMDPCLDPSTDGEFEACTGIPLEQAIAYGYTPGVGFLLDLDTEESQR